MADLSFRIILTMDDATGKLEGVKQELDGVKKKAEEPKVVKLSAEQALGTIRDVKLALDGVIAAVKGFASGMNALLDANLKQKQAMQLAAHEWGEGAKSMSNFATQMQKVTNFGDDDLLPLMSKLSQTFKLNKDEIQQLVPVLLDFTEATKATGMTVESAFDLMGRALNGHTEMLGRYGIELDDTRLKTEGVSYLVEKLAADYGGTAVALADLRTQNQIAWGDIQESVGGMLETVLNPVLQALKWLMDAFTSLHPAVQGFIAGLVIAVPLIATTATVVATLTTAIHALKTAINPVAGIIGLAVGALSVLTFTIGGTISGSQELAVAQKSVADSIHEAQMAVDTEATKFEMLSTRLLELRGKTELTKQDKQELSNIVNTMNQKYGEYIGNINLETTAYNELSTALEGAANALISKQVAQVYGERYQAQLDRVARLQVQLTEAERLYGEAVRRNVTPADSPTARIATQRLEELRGSLSSAKADLTAFSQAYRDALLDIPSFTSGGGGNTSRPPQSDAEEAERRRSYERMREEFQTAAKSETDIINMEYTKRLAMIRRYTEENSIARALDMQGLEAWHTEELQKISTKEKELSEQSFKDQIDYYANLENLGVSSYDAMKRTMEEYYAWAKANLPEEEQKLILLQLRETNLKWGQARAKREQEEWDHQMELMAAREEFADKQRDLDNNTYEAQLLAVELYYEKRKAKLIEAGMTEEQIEKQKGKALRQLQMNSAQQMAQGLSTVLGSLAGSADKESRSGFAIWKGLSYAQAMVDMYASATGAYKSMVGIPVVGPGLAVAAAAAAVAAGLANIRNIGRTKYEKKAATGMYVDGPSHAQGGVPIEAEGGEYIVNKGKVSALGKRFFDWLNFAPVGAIKGAISGLALPSFNMPLPDYAYASGGMVQGGNSLDGLAQAIAMLTAKIESIGRPVVNVAVDPLSNNPVKISEINERGDMIRGRY